MDSPDQTGQRLDQAGFSALVLGGGYDFSDLGRDEVDHPYGWSGLHAVKLIEAYKKGDLSVVFELSAGVDARKFNLVFFSVPAWRKYLSSTLEHCRSQLDGWRERPDGDQQPMLIGTTELVECPEGVIPSFVSIEAAEQRFDLGRDVATPPFHHTVKVSNLIGDGEIGVFGIGNAPKDGGGVSGLVQRGSESLDRLNGSIDPAIREIARELDRVGRKAFRIHILDTLVWFLFEEGLNTLLKPSRVFLSTPEPTLWAFEGVEFSGHGKGFKG
jgi:hypothetical protein